MPTPRTPLVPPTVPVSCSAILLDGQGRLLVVKPAHKSGWSIPGGAMHTDGETPWQACRREVFEETALRVRRGRLVVVDTRPHVGRQLGLRFLFHCGTVAPEDAAAIRPQPGEITDFGFVEPERALRMLRPAISRRVAVGLRARTATYLEDGAAPSGILR